MTKADMSLTPEKYALLIWIEARGALNRTREAIGDGGGDIASRVSRTLWC